MFFSLNKLLALLILLVTFFSPLVGICGFMGIVLINVAAFFIGFNREEIKQGIYGFNALFLGLALGYEFSFNGTFIFLFITAIFVLLLITVCIKGLFGLYQLPFLSFPFIISYWIVSLAAYNFNNIHLDESHVFAVSAAVINQKSVWYNLIHSVDNINIPHIALVYFKTLAGTFFQTSVLGGILLAFGLLYFSRIAFSLSILGFITAYLFYSIFGADVNDLNINLQGANFIFLSIAIGCFFLIPNIYSYLTVLILIPVLLMASLFFGKIAGIFQLKSYTFSFSVVCTAVLFALNQRWLHNYLQIITTQYFSAEKTIYKYLNSLQRFKNEHLYKLSLPFSGEWNVSQGYDGSITHLGEWSKALDFVIVDSKGNTYKEPTYQTEGFHRENFYCYNKEILAPYDGYVYDIINTVEENDIGDVNTAYNWGNTIIINHLNGLFSQISHVKKDSFNVFVGQYVTKGTFLATCGNSGRSPEPHIHFQLQTIPTIGAVTLPYPIAYFIERNGIEKTLHISEVPKQGSFISNIQVNELLCLAFSLLPGKILKLKNNSTGTSLEWEVFTDAYNKSYLYCKQSNSYAYFVNDGMMIYFTDFEGDKNSTLFHFYLAVYRQLLGYYEQLEVVDKVPLIHFNNPILQFFQDFFAPFYLFTNANFTSKFSYTDNMYAPQHVIIQSSVKAKITNFIFKAINYELELKNQSIATFTIHQKNSSIHFEFIN
jgi:urea transporter/murein DD-endopeptidase MepM/ murein hydrolase activator NlpD